MSNLSLFGIKVHPFSLEQILEFIDQKLSQKKGMPIVSLNPEILMALTQDPLLVNSINQNECNIIDGEGLAWALKFKYHQPFMRLAGVEIVEALLKKGGTFFFIGGLPNQIEQTRQKIETNFKQAQFLGFQHGFFNSSEEQELVRQLERLKPQYILVGMGFPKQEWFIFNYPQLSQHSVLMAVGGSLDVITGRKKRAPRLWQKLKLEWLYRLIGEPQRLWRMRVLPVFVWRVLWTRGK